MAKKSAIAKNKKRAQMVDKYAAKRAALKEIANDEERPMEERFKARLKLAKLPRNSSATRLHTCVASLRSRRSGVSDRVPFWDHINPATSTARYRR